MNSGRSKTCSKRGNLKAHAQGNPVLPYAKGSVSTRGRRSPNSGAHRSQGSHSRTTIDTAGALIEVTQSLQYTRQRELITGVSAQEQRYSQCPRKLGKYTLIYGMGDEKLANTLGISIEAAQQKSAQYLRVYPAVNAFAEESIRETEETGYSFTVMGRRRNIPEIASRNRRDRGRAERLAKNTPIQGCLPATTKILTKEGYVPIGSAPEQGTVWTGNSWESYTKLDRGPAELAKLTLANGQTLNCDVRHSVLVNTGDKYEFKQYDQLEPGDNICLSLATPLVFGTQHNPEHFYWMGFFIGNAHTSHNATHPNAVTTCIGDRVKRYYKEEKVQQLTHYSKNLLGVTTQKPQVRDNKVTVTIERESVRKFYETLGYPWGKHACDKYVPTSVWTASYACRSQFIIGLLDADRYLHEEVPNIHLCQRRLLEEVQIIARTCGVESTVRSLADGTYRIDLNGSQCAQNLNYGKLRSTKIHMPVPLEGVKHACATCDPTNEVHRVIINRARRTNQINTYTLEEIYRQHSKPITAYGLYATYALVSKEKLGRHETTYTLSVDSPLHRFDSEGVISKNSAADVIKMAQIGYDQLGFERDYGCRMLLQVHDELVFECPKQHSQQMLKEIKYLMEHPFSKDLAVQLLAEGGIGPSWGAAKG